VSGPRLERAFDLLVVLLVTPIALVLGSLIAIAVYIDSPGPVLYRARRIGLDGKPFSMVKFRKMLADAHRNDALTVADDERFTPIGRFLAVTRLDELPNLLNVLRGDMRVVGPRPEIEEFVAQFPREYAEILTIKPGMSGNAALAFLDERRLLDVADAHAVYAASILPVKLSIDLAYVREHTLTGDLGILLRTAALPGVLIARALRTRPHLLRSWVPLGAGAFALAFIFIFAGSRLG
jgi:lipopolysaccharide/colanic/teichoic acid biosynthesis glycosyltransferase